MSVFEQEEQNATDLLKFIYKCRKIILFSLLFGGLLGASVALLQNKKYLSTGIIYPANNYNRDQLLSNPQFGTEVETEQLMQLLESQSIRDSVINKFDLIGYYKIDKSDKDWKNQLNLKFIKDITFFRSKYLSVVISAKTTDPKMSANIVNYIISVVNNYKTQIFADNRKKELAYQKSRVSSQEKVLDSIENQIYALKDTSEIDNLISNYLNLAGKENYVPSDFIDSRKMEDLFESYRIQFAIYKDYQQDFLQAKDQIKKPIVDNYVVDIAEPNYKKVSPSLSLHIILGALGLSLLSCLFVILRQKLDAVKEP
jgi:uncharacterized protein involved in exopolysaccharide biosynthesis